MTSAALFAAVVCAAVASIATESAGGAGPKQDVLYTLTDEQYYQMPQLFELDNYYACLARRGVYCLGSFELSPGSRHHQLFHMMQGYSLDWVNHFNHTRLHRGWCVSERCKDTEPSLQTQTSSLTPQWDYEDWFASCVNSSTMSSYNLSAHLYKLEYCQRGPLPDDPPLSDNERAFAGVVVALLALAVVSTVLDVTLADHCQKNIRWALCWSVPRCWRKLSAPQPTSSDVDLRCFDGLRVLCINCVIIGHVCFLLANSYVASARDTEQSRAMSDTMMVGNSTLLVQSYFIMSAFLLAYKLLKLQDRGEPLKPVSMFVKTMVNRIVRISPSYYITVWFATSWWQRLGSGPLWTRTVVAEAEVCRQKWWTHLLYLNNVLYADDKCLIQTWYLAADMQLYVLTLLLSMALWRWRSGALYVVTALFVAVTGVVYYVSYALRIHPTYMLHNPESMQAKYWGEASFNWGYQSPLSNAAGALAGVMLAMMHQIVRRRGIQLNTYKSVVWWQRMAVPMVALYLWWGAGVAGAWGELRGRGANAAVAALERPLMHVMLSVALLGGINGLPSTLNSVLSWSGWRVLSRLSFGALLVHMPLYEALLASKLVPVQLDHTSVLPDWFSLAALAFLAAVPLALLVEIPVQNLHRCIEDALSKRPDPQPATQSDEKTNL